MNTLSSFIQQEKRKKEILDLVHEFCNLNDSRCKKDLYYYLSEKLEIEIKIPDAYTFESLHPKFGQNEESQKREVDFIMNNLL